MGTCSDVRLGETKGRRPDIERTVEIVKNEDDLTRLCAVMHGYKPNGCSPQKKRILDGAASLEPGSSSTSFELPNWLGEAVAKRRLVLRTPIDARPLPHAMPAAVSGLRSGFSSTSGREVLPPMDEAARLELQSSLAAIFQVSPDRVSSIRKDGHDFSLIEVAGVVTRCNKRDAAKKVREVV